MLSNTLNTNEVKDATSAEVEFQSLSQQGRQHIWAQITETPALPHRLSINHQETGAGMKMRRRSVVRVDKTVISGVDSATPITVSAYIVLDLPVGAMSTITEGSNVLAELTSFVATAASTSISYNGTGTGAAALLSGGI